VFQYIFYIINLLVNFQYLTNIEEKNMLKAEFRKSFVQKDYQRAIIKYKELEDISFLIEPEMRINVANAYFLTGDTINARKNYGKTLGLGGSSIQSASLNQLGILAAQSGDSLKALGYFKQAIEVEPENNPARYNFEYVRKKYAPPSPPPPSVSEDQQISQGKVESSEEKKDVLDPYNQAKISKEKALQLLDNLKNSENKKFKKTKNSTSKITKDW
jgi:tetratricopeptide (TPR) repeat protein